MNTFKVALYTLLLLIPNIAFSAVIYESALLGPTGMNEGVSIGQKNTTRSMLGCKFTLSNRTWITAVGGHMANSSQVGGYFDPDARIFVAIVSLDSPYSLPSFLPSKIEENALAVSTFIPGDSLGNSQDLKVPLSILLQPGEYALIFGTAHFGATGEVTMPLNNPVLTDLSFFDTDTSSGDYWIFLMVSDTSFLRFFLEGTPVTNYNPALKLLLINE